MSKDRLGKLAGDLVGHFEGLNLLHTQTRYNKAVRDVLGSLLRCIDLLSQDISRLELRIVELEVGQNTQRHDVGVDLSLLDIRVQSLENDRNKGATP